MEINALVNHNDIHNTPAAERFYRLRLQRLSQPQFPTGPGPIRRKPRAKELSRDEKHTIQVLRTKAKWDYWAICRATGASWSQVQGACNSPLTPRTNRRGRKPSQFTPDEKDRITHALNDDPIARKLRWEDLRWYLEGFERFRDQAFTTAMRKAGFKRKVPPRRIKLTAQHREARLAFAREQLALRPCPEDWERVLFSDETWATNSHMWKRWLTIYDTEDIGAWASIRQKPHGWMFWGSICGPMKGPSFVWEKEYGGINSEKY